LLYSIILNILFFKFRRKFYEKKKIIFLIIVLVSVLIFSIYSYANNLIKEKKGEAFNNIFTTGKNIKVDNIEQSKKINFLDNNDITLTYQKSQQGYQLTADIYTDNQNNEYIYQGNKLTGFLRDYKSVNNTRLDTNIERLEQSTIRDIAKNIIPKLLDIDLKKYDLVNELYVESYDEYVFTFTKTINGYKTTESISISFDSYANLSSFSAPRIAMFDRFENIEIDEKDVNDFIDNYMNETYDFIKYEVEDKILNVIEGKPILECYIVIKLNGDNFNPITTDILVYYL